MDRKRVDTQFILNTYHRDLASYITVENVFLFGSYVKGNPTEESDIDCMIISKDFTAVISCSPWACCECFNGYFWLYARRV